MTEKTYRCLGIMTGNSLDAIDIVVTEFCNREIRDIGFFSQEFPRQMAQRFRAVKRFLAENDGDIEAAIAHPQLALDSLIDDYTSAVAAAVNNALQTNCIPAASVDAIGFHGQTCAHCPPSVSTADTYTLQVGNGQMLADLTGIPVIFDFRSDDLMNGGEGAPFAPAHNLHLAYSLRQRGIFPVAFCNGGNTGNIAVISARTQKGKAGVCGFDTGPFNHFVDYLARTEQNLPCDLDGGCGRLGKINYSLLRELFNKAAVTRNGRNFILRKPPKSSDPAWYKIIPALTNPATSFADRIRTAEFLQRLYFYICIETSPRVNACPCNTFCFLAEAGIIRSFWKTSSGFFPEMPEFCPSTSRFSAEWPILRPKLYGLTLTALTVNIWKRESLPIWQNASSPANLFLFPEPPVAAAPPSEASLPAPAKTTGTAGPAQPKAGSFKTKSPSERAFANHGLFRPDKTYNSDIWSLLPESSHNNKDSFWSPALLTPLRLSHEYPFFPEAY